MKTRTQTMETTREQLMGKLLKSYPDMILHTTEEFNGSKGGIWTSAEDCPLDRNEMPLFDYYAEGSYYELGVALHFYNFLERNGWYAEWYDCGTMMIYLI